MIAGSKVERNEEQIKVVRKEGRKDRQMHGKMGAERRNRGIKNTVRRENYFLERRMEGKYRK